MYTARNFKSKKALKEAVAAGEKITVFQPNDMFGNPAAAPDYSGRITLEGPHYPEPHRWYASAILENGYVVKVS
jgi:hypothetical protein